LGIEKEAVKCSWVRITAQTKKGNTVVGACFRPPNHAEAYEVFFRQREKSSCLQALILMRDFNHPKKLLEGQPNRVQALQDISGVHYRQLPDTSD